MSDIFLATMAEVQRAREKFPDPKHLLHALTEEHGEVVKAALEIYEGKGDYLSLEKEIIQLMAMCLRLHDEGDPAINLKCIARGLRAEFENIMKEKI